MLERLYVDNYRCLVNFECRFRPSQLILGPNGAGKTTLFNVLAVVRDFCINGAPGENLFLGTTLTRWQLVPEETFELGVAGNQGHYTFRLVVDSWGRPVARPRVVLEEVQFDGQPIFRFANGEVQLFNDRHENKVKYPFDWSRSALATVIERPENTRLSWFKRWFSGLLFISPDPHQMSALAASEAAFPTINMSNFGAWYRHLRLESDDQKLLDDLRSAMPGFQEMNFQQVGPSNYYVQPTFQLGTANGQPSKRYLVGFDELSDGQRVLIGLYAVLHFARRRDGATLLFDEPDNYIALKEIQPWVDRVLDATEEDDPKQQVLIISHHPGLLDRLAATGGIVMDRPGGRHTRARPFSDPAQTGLSPAELVARGWDNE